MATACSPLLVTAQPRLVIDGPVFDFGHVDQGMTVDHVFRLLNQGTTPLQLDAVKVSCGCTIAATSATEIPPGQAGELTVRLDTLKLAGRTTKTITIPSNDPAMPLAGVSLTGEVWTDVVAAPAAVFFGHLSQGRAVRYEVAIAAGRPGASVTVVDVQAGSRYLTARLDTAADGSGSHVIVETRPDMPPGNFNADVVISTSSPRTPTVVVPVFGVIDRQG